MELQQFIAQLVQLARTAGHIVEVNNRGQMQIDFGHKKLHAGHFEKLFPAVLQPNANVGRLIERVAPGRPCTHRPMREMIQRFGISR